MLANTQLIDYSKESGCSAKSLNYLLVVAQKSQRSRKTLDHTKAKKVHCACCLLEMKGSSKGMDVDVLGTKVDDATSKQMVIDVLASDVNALKVRDEVLPQHIEELAMVVHKDVTEIHEEANVHDAAIVAIPIKEKTKGMVTYFSISSLP
jgi:hypothetical protein